MDNFDSVILDVVSFSFGGVSSDLGVVSVNCGMVSITIEVLERFSSDICLWFLRSFNPEFNPEYGEGELFKRITIGADPPVGAEWEFSVPECFRSPKPVYFKIRGLHGNLLSGLFSGKVEVGLRYRKSSEDNNGDSI